MTLEEIKNKFSKKQLKLHEKIKTLIGDQPAIALASLQGESATSQKEILIMATIIEQFTPIEIMEFKHSPRKVLLSGIQCQGHPVTIQPQYKVKNTNPKAQPWSIDLAIELYRLVGDERIKIGALAIEYDGHPSHFLESGVKTSYKRDMNIISTEDMNIFRISADAWKEDPKHIASSIKKLFNRKIFFAEILLRSALKTFRPKSYIPNDKFITCPICNELGKLAGDYCPACRGLGRVKSLTAQYLKVDEYEIIECKLCKQQTSCKLCMGTGVTTLAKAREHERHPKDRAN